MVNYLPLLYTGLSGTFECVSTYHLGKFKFFPSLFRQGHLATAILLIKHGADPMVYDGEGFQSLHLAAQFGHTAVCAYLLSHGVPVNSPDMQGMTPLMWAVFRTTT